MRVWLARGPFDAIVLDVVLPDIDGFEVCRRIRAADRWPPLLMLTARDDVSRPGPRSRRRRRRLPDQAVRVRGAARAAFARSSGAGRGNGRRRCEVGDLELDPAAHAVTRAATPIALTPKEFALLAVPDAPSRRGADSDRLLEHVWDFAFDGDPNIVDVYVGYLRDKVDRPFGRASDRDRAWRRLSAAGRARPAMRLPLRLRLTLVFTVGMAVVLRRPWTFLYTPARRRPAGVGRPRSALARAGPRSTPPSVPTARASCREGSLIDPDEAFAAGSRRLGRDRRCQSPPWPRRRCSARPRLSALSERRLHRPISSPGSTIPCGSLAVPVAAARRRLRSWSWARRSATSSDALAACSR